MNLTNHKPKNQREALLGLGLIDRLGIQRIRLLLQAVDHPAEIFTLSKSELEQVNGIGPHTAELILSFDDWSAVDAELEKAQRLGAELITYLDDNYPPLLREIYDPPLLIWIKGNADVLNRPGIAVVGTRRATAYGRETAQKLSGELAEKGLSIVSGLAFGVDAAAHKATVNVGGTTVAVLGSGIDVIYPQKNAELAGEIIETGGAVITEFAPGTPPDAGNFPERNRIVSGLTLGTLVVESGLKGGSMITAQSALMQNREVFVVPHSLKNVNGQGCNHLIKRGAGKLVQTVDDIIEELPLHETVKLQGQESKSPQKASWKSLDLDEKSRQICELLSKKPMHIDDLSEATGTPSHALLAKLLELEMQECVRQRAGKNFELA